MARITDTKVREFIQVAIGLGFDPSLVRVVPAWQVTTGDTLLSLDDDAPLVVARVDVGKDDVATLSSDQDASFVMVHKDEMVGVVEDGTYTY